MEPSGPVAGRVTRPYPEYDPTVRPIKPVILLCAQCRRMTLFGELPCRLCSHNAPGDPYLRAEAVLLILKRFLKFHKFSSEALETITASHLVELAEKPE